MITPHALESDLPDTGYGILQKYCQDPVPKESRRLFLMQAGEPVTTMVTALGIVNPTLIVAALALVITLVYGSWLDIRERQVPKILWYPALVVGIPCTLWFYGIFFLDHGALLTFVILIPILAFILLFYGFARYNLFGLADAKALILVAVLLPAYPLVPIFGFPPFGPYAFLSFTVLINAVILNLLVPPALFVKNLSEGHRAPFPYMFLGFPVRADRLPDSFGVVIEEITIHEGGITRRFLGIREAVSGMIRGGNRVYTRDLRENPEEYQKEREAYRLAGHVWISYGVPFLVPVTAGLIVALLAGDILGILMKGCMGAV